jgi:hypothetical protein
MASLGTITLVGKSGARYRFMAYPLGTIFKKGFAAVFIATQRTLKPPAGSVRHKPLFLGHSADLHAPNVDVSNALPAAANCICVHAEKNERERLDITQDLMALSGQHGSR